MAKKRNELLPASKELAKGSLLKPIKLADLGTSSDPCFGTSYDLSTSECKLCGDSELCCLQTAAHLGKTRKELENTSNFKDIEEKLDLVGLKKYYRGLVRGNKSKKEIITAMMTKYELTHDEGRSMYKQFHNNSKNN